MVSEPPRKSISKEGNKLNDALSYRLITSSSRYAFLPLIYPVYPAKRLKRSGAKSSGLISPNLYAGRKITIPCNWVVSTGRINNTAESLSRSLASFVQVCSFPRWNTPGKRLTLARYPRVSAYPRAFARGTSLSLARDVLPSGLRER